MYATGSEMDRRVGARVNALLEKGAENRRVVLEGLHTVDTDLRLVALAYCVLCLNELATMA